jgi:Flp pilus assembly protein TadG
MVEFALILPLLLIILFGIVDAGRFFFRYNELQNAVREGARAGAVMAIPDLTLIRQRIAARVTAEGVDVAPLVSFCPPPVPAPPPNQQTVCVQLANFPFEPILPLVGAFQFGVIRAEFRSELQ